MSLASFFVWSVDDIGSAFFVYVLIGFCRLWWRTVHAWHVVECRRWTWIIRFHFLSEFEHVQMIVEKIVISFSDRVATWTPIHSIVLSVDSIAVSTSAEDNVTIAWRVVFGSTVSCMYALICASKWYATMTSVHCWELWNQYSSNLHSVAWS